ncbi:MAG: ATP/GTP-binding protein [Candidatus Odinarchaeum yellowstonii]|uniref:ATP/GTP-binding protein n=1 Tax=Odinarchaeota yellowstonii (strain LCB_4) TaxID=1841599 RepID=A0AAF0D1S1_ODILC|nr:MAG: ATP/GTP-binding protein [Candidatus Odinarchaeum yellowstonii]
MTPLGVFLLGPGGVGKTSLMKALIDLTVENNIRCAAVNLDPGCTSLPFQVVFDARDIVTVDGLMREENVGPNYAMIAAFTRIVEERAKIFKAIVDFKPEIVYFDTPGQMEVFLFNKETPVFLSEISSYVKPIGVFIMDNMMVKDAGKLVVTELLSLSFQLHLEIRMVTVINKVDLGIPPDINRMVEDTEYLANKVEAEKTGLEKDLILGLIPRLREIRGSTRVIYTSTSSGSGILDLFNIIHEAFCACGDLT